MASTTSHQPTPHARRARAALATVRRAAALALLPLLASTANAQGRAYSVVLLQGAPYEVTALSESGEAIGRDMDSQALKWSTTGVPTPLLTGYSSTVFPVPLAINAHGQIVGRADVWGKQAVRFVDDGRLEQIPLEGSRRSDATAINNRGDVVGSVDDDAFLWNETDGTIRFGLGPHIEPRAINNNRVVVGRGYGRSIRYAFYWTPENGARQMRDITDLVSVNAAGVAIGTRLAGAGGLQGVVYRPEGGARPLPVLPRSERCEPRDINAAGVIVGQCTGTYWEAVSCDKSEGRHRRVTAVRWMPRSDGGYEIAAFSSLLGGGTMCDANSINEAGAVLVMRGGYRFAVLTPTQ